MKRRFLSTLMALVLALSLIPTAAFAEEGEGVSCSGGAECLHVAEVGDLHYSSLSAAVAAVQSSGTVKLLRNVGGQSEISISDGRSITLNLNGYDVGFARNQHINLSNGDLNLTGRGMLYEEYPYYAPIMVFGSSNDEANYSVVTVGKEVILHGWAGLFIDQNDGANYGIVANVYGTLESVKDTAGDGGHALYVNGQITATTENVPQITLNGATLTTEEGNGMYLAGYTKTTITNSTITSIGEDSTGIEIRAGELEITNSEIYGGDEPYAGAPNGNGSTSKNVALAVAQHTTNLPIKVVVNSGKFEANAAFIQANPQRNDQTAIDAVSIQIDGGEFDGQVYSENKTGFITGGTFSTDVSDYVSENLDLIANGDGTFSVGTVDETNAIVTVAKPDTTVEYYGTLAEAVSHAEAGDTVTLRRNASTEPITITEGIVLDLGGNTLTLVKDSVPSAVGLYFNNSGENVLRNGTVLDERSKDTTYAGFITVRLSGGGTLTTEGVEISNYQPDSSSNYNYILRADGTTGTLTLNSGTVLSELERTTQNNSTYGTVGVALYGNATTTTYTETINLVVNEGVKIETMGFAISGNGSNCNGTNITINGGEIISTTSTAIYHPQYGTMTINGGTITGENAGIEIRAGAVTVNGGTISGLATPTETTSNGNGTTSSGAGIAVAQHTTKLPIKLIINDGTINGYSALYESNTENSSEEDLAKINLSVTGGTFYATNGGTQAVYSEDKTQFISAGTFSTGVATYVETGKYSVGGTNGMFTVETTPPENPIRDTAGNYYASDEAAAAGSVASITRADDTTTTYYASFEAAMTALHENETITLWKDVNPLDEGTTVRNNAVITLPAGVTLNGNDHTITAGTWTTDANGDPQFHILGVADIADGEENRVTVKNLTIVGNATTKHGFNAYGSTNTPEVTLDNVTIRNCGTAAVVVNHANVTATDLKTSGNVWGAVNVDNQGKFTLQGNANSMAENAQIWTEIAESEINVDNSNYGNLQKVTGGDGDLAGKTYYTDDPAKLGEATVEKDDGTVTVYEDLNNALKEENLTDTETVTVVDNATLNDSATIPSGVTLVVNQGVTLTIPSGVTLTNKGTIENHGKIEGTVTGDTEALTSAVTFVTTPSYATVTVTGQTPASGKTYNLTDGNYSYTVSASGYVTVTGTFTVSGNAQTIPVILTAISTDSSSGGSSDPSYSPVLDVSDGGTIRVNPRTPSYGDKVTITPDPDRGYEVDEVIVRDRNGNRVDVTANRNGTYTFEQPRGRVTIEVTFVPTGTVTFFTDVPASFWAYDEIKWAYDNGYVNGTSATTFSPNASISRQQVWMILARLSGQSPANMAEARQWAIDNGISDGTTPGNAVTRQQLVALLYRYATMMGYANDARADLSIYPDVDTVASYAVEPMQWSVANNIVAGTSDGTLNPTGTATRAQFAVILYRFMNQG